MPSSFNARFRVATQDGVKPQPSNQRGLALFGGALLLCGVLFLLYVNFGFARYALTGFLWMRTDGTVLSPSRTSTPTIQFTSGDGAAHVFTEDYVILCGGRRTFCFIRDFNPGQLVPVVYDPGAPQRAFVHDWALFSSTITWFLEAGAALLLALMLAVALAKKPLAISVQLGSRRDNY